MNASFTIGAQTTGLVKEGATGASSLDEVVEKLTKPRAVWIMLPRVRLPKRRWLPSRNCLPRVTPSLMEATHSVKTTSGALAPGPGDIPNTPGREGMKSTAEQGYLYCGPSGAGHLK
jgi:6-phosphogluconate dehydrogenase (decarboxylating)